MATGSIKIGPEFFVKERNAYANWRAAIAREFCQNCIDAPGSDLIEVSTSFDGTTTRLEVKNNGAPMDREILVDKLLSLGGSGKAFAGTVGGFGIAKTLLYFGNDSFRIRTGEFLVEGVGANYELTESLEHIHGTTSTITVAGDRAEEFAGHFRAFARDCNWDGEIVVNGVKTTERTSNGRFRKEFPWGRIHTRGDKSLDYGRMLVRIGGMPMFSKSIDYKGLVIVELTGNSGDSLTSNRDGLRWDKSAEMDLFLTALVTNKRAAFKDEATIEKTRYEGYKLAGRPTKTTVSSLENDIETVAAALTRSDAAVEMIARISRATESGDAPAISTERVAALLRPEFHTLSEIGGTIPAWFLPGTFSDNSKRLVSNWMAVLVELADLTGFTTPFAIGFNFSTEALALWSRDQDGCVIYVNPAEVVEKEGKPRQLKTAWKFDAAGNWRLLATAVHEFCHHRLGNGTHSEEFANLQTELTTLVLTNRTRFSRHFSAPISWPQ